MATLNRRIQKVRDRQETQRLVEEPVPGIYATPDTANARYFHLQIAGPIQSPFEG